MYCNIPTFICEVSFDQHMEKVQFMQVMLMIVIQAFQYLSFLLPMNGWGIWNYQENLLYSLQKISSYCQIVPIFKDQIYEQILFNFTIIWSLGTILFLTLAFFCYNFKVNTPLKIVYWIFLLSSNLFYLPLLSLFTIQTGCEMNTNMDTCNQILNQENILSIFCVLLITLFNLCWHYFFCNFTFFPLNLFYQKFTLLAFILNFLNVVVSYLNRSNDTDGTLKYIKVTLLHAIFLMHMKQFQTQSYTSYKLNKLGLAIFSCLELWCIIISIVIFQEKQGQQENLAFVLLLFVPLCFSLVYQIKSENNPNNCQSCVIYVEILYQHYLNVKDYKKQESYFILNQMLVTQGFNLKNVKKSIYQFIRMKLEQFSAQNYEPLLLLFLSYLDRVFNKPLLGFVELRRYEILESEQSYFFTKMKSKIEGNLKKEIERQQKKKKTIYQLVDFERALGLEEVHQSLFLQQELLPLLNELLDYKIHLMTQQIQGFQNIYQFYELILKQTQKMKFLEKQMYQFDHLNTLNIIQLKILSIFYSLIMNDYHQSLVSEKAIEEILAYDHSASNDIISNQKLINNQVTLVKLSLIRDKGLILNKNREQLAQYFDYDLQEFQQIKYIKELMPSFIATQHDGLLTQYLSTAKSSYFDQFRQIFSKNKEGYLISQQLSLDNDFTVESDYVLLGCIHQLKSSYEYILFTDEGKLLGMTKQIHQLITQDQIVQYTVESLVDNSFVYIYFRSIIEIIIDYKKSLLSSYSQQTEAVTTLCTYNKLHQILEFQKKQMSLQPLGNSFRYGEKQSSQTFQQGRSQVESSNLINENQGAMTSNTNQENIALFDQIYQERIVNFIQSLPTSDVIEYTLRIVIDRKTIGPLGKQKGYFIMEMQDIKKKLIQTITTDTLAVTVQISSINTTNQDSKVSSFNYSDNEEPIKEMCPRKQPTDFNQLLSALSPRYINEDHLLQNESGRDNYNLAPLSQRVNFINPSFSKQLIDRDFNDLQLQFEQDINYSKQLANDEQSKVPNDSSKQKSNNILAIFKLNKTLNNVDKEQRSVSSQTSKTSGISASQIIRNFQQQQTMSYSLKSILFLNLTLVLILIIYIIIMSIVIQTQEASTSKQVDDINGPMKLIRFYMKIYQLSSIQYLDDLNLVNNSNFIINQCISQLSDVKLTIVDELFTYYDNFIRLSSAGDFQNVTFQYHNLQVQEVNFLDFYYLLLNLAEELLAQFNQLDNLLLLRFNLDNLEEESSFLIDAISAQFYNILIQKEWLIEIIVIVEIIAFTLCFYGQVFFWNSVQNYIQTIILLVGRVSEVQQRDQILRIHYAKETLDKLVGKGSWMRTNFYNLMYLPLEDSKIQFKSKFATKLILHDQQQQKKQLSTVLNHKILNTKTNIFKTLVIMTITQIVINIYLVGAYLIYTQSQTSLLPTQHLSIKFIKFATNLDSLVTYAYIIKTQPIYLEYFQENKLSNEYSELVVDSIIKRFTTLFSGYDDELDSIFTAIDGSNQMSASDQKFLKDLFQSDLCTIISSIPYCQFEKLGNQSFSNQYGSPVNIDDDREFISQGIIGITSQINSLIRQSYDYELTNQSYIQSTQQLDANSQAYNNAIIEHFISTSIGTTQFFQLIEENLQQIMNSNLNKILIYIYTLGSVLAVIYCIFYVMWIIKIHNELKLLRMILPNLPIDILTEQHTLSQIKRLS